MTAAVLIDDLQTVAILRAYARGMETRHVPSATGLPRDLVLDVLERIAGHDRSYAQQLVRERDAQAAARPSPTPTTAAPTSTPEVSSARTTAPAAPAAAASTVAAPAVAPTPPTGRAEPSPRPRRRGRIHPAEPAAGDELTADAAPAAAEPLQAGQADARSEDQVDLVDVDSGPLSFGTTHLCRRCRSTSPQPAVCCRLQMTPMRVKLHRIAS